MGGSAVDGAVGFIRLVDQCTFGLTETDAIPNLIIGRVA